ncbi:MAG: hypothetical protein ACD_79C00270G0003 [uncultured bacterium]|nr:MAG: hypothetical protein ACD_79C00270G0003 [uncultured bacterium]
MVEIEIKKSIQLAIQSFATFNLTEGAISFFKTLGYNTARQNPFEKKKYSEFKANYGEVFADKKFSEDKALTKEWKSVDLLFQLTKDEISNQNELFDTKKVNNTIIETYLFFVIELTQSDYSRTTFSQITREVNKIFPMPVMIVFKHGNHITFAIINRRLHKKDERKDVLEKVTLIKDISIENPHRAHIEILFDLSFDELLRIHKFSNFVDLHNAWQKTLDTKELNKRFYRDLSNWYFWALTKVSFPNDVNDDRDDTVFNSENIIRLLTRLIFIWFIKEKNLIPEKIFEKNEISKLIHGFNIKNSMVYYRAILQNLFFATLNQKIEERKFATDGTFEQNKKNYGIKNLYRYSSDFAISKDKVIKLFEKVPFLNGGLFDCLDSEDKAGKVMYLDGFSRNSKKQAQVPDELFFSEEKIIDLSSVYDDKKKKNEKVKGLFEIFNNYKFTITENTPIEEEVALDPELLGRVFENLLANFNPETKTTARKQTGSFYTPREIVNYMVDESLKAYLKQKLETEAGMKPEDAEVGLEFLLGYNEKEHLFDKKQTVILINAIDSCNILDPACGSGAFPMGILHKLVHILGKLDSKNKLWKERQIEKAEAIDDTAIRDNLIEDIETAFNNNELDYGRKLFLIENCIYGVDIQPIAIQISKLRFFISLIVDQKVDKTRDNFGIRSLPNLETKFVAANTLIGLEKPEQLLLRNPQIDKLEEDLKKLRHEYFSAKTRNKKHACQEKDKDLRVKISGLLVKDGWDNETAKKIAAFDPYAQNSSAPFFDMEWMFGLTGGFDVVIGNPPYVSANNMSIHERNYFNKSVQYKTLNGKWDLYVVFIEKSLNNLNLNGAFSFIIPFGFLNQPFAEEIRKFIIKDFSLISIVDLHNNKIFESATVPSCIPIIQKKSSTNHKVKILEFNQGYFLTKYQIDIQKYHDGNQHMFRTEDLGKKSELLNKIKARGEILENDFYISTGAEIHGKESRSNNGTTISGTSKFDVLHDKFAKELKPYIEGSAIQKSREGRYSYPIIETWLDYNKADIMRSPKFKELFDSDKIIIRRSSGLLRILAIYDQKKIYTSEKCILIILKSDLPTSHRQYEKENKLELKYLLALINSRLIDFYYESVYGGFIDVYPNNLKELPIVKAIDSVRRNIIVLVDYLLQLKIIINTSVQIQFFDNLIDCVVYELYQLESIKSTGCELLKNLNDLTALKDEWSDEKKIKTIEKVYKELSDPAHPVSIAMEKMKTIPEVCIIEGLDK